MLDEPIPPTSSSTQKKERFSFSWDERLHRRRDFKRVFETGRRFRVQGLTLWALPSKNKTQPRLGLAISRRFGNAVRRNRLKRLLREIFRLNKATLPKGVDMIFTVQPFRIMLHYRTLEPLVKDLWKKADLLGSINSSPSSPAA